MISEKEYWEKWNEAHASGRELMKVKPEPRADSALLEAVADKEGWRAKYNVAQARIRELEFQIVCLEQECKELSYAASKWAEIRDKVLAELGVN